MTDRDDERPLHLYIRAGRYLCRACAEAEVAIEGGEAVRADAAAEIDPSDSGEPLHCDECGRRELLGRYEIYLAPGWHGQPEDPIVGATDDRETAALIAGENLAIKIPGDSAAHRYYAADSSTGERLEPLESFRCDVCGDLFPWGEHGPIGTKDGRVLECPGGVEHHLITWCCESCAAEMEED